MGGCCSSADNEVEGGDDGNELDELMHAGDDGQSTRVELSLRCKGLRTAGGSAPAASCVAVYELVSEEGRETQRRLLGRTEAKPRSRYPVFSRSVYTTYEFQHVQELEFELVDEGRREQTLGTARVKLPQLIESSPMQLQLTKELQSKRGETRQVAAGTLLVTAEEMGKHQGPIFEVIMEVGCKDLEAKNLFGAGGSDPFLVISRIVEGQFQTLYKTEYITGVLECQWKPIVIKLDKLCKGDFNSWLLFEVWDFENSGRHQLIGYTRQTLATLLAKLETEIDLMHDGSRGKVFTKFGPPQGGQGGGLRGLVPFRKEPYERSGALVVKSICIDTAHSFLEYVRAGFEINLTICVDFSKSNGPLDDPSSLHYVAPSGVRNKNEYVQALESVVKVLGEYDKDQEFTFWGFGARPKNAGSPTQADAGEGGLNKLKGLAGGRKGKDDEGVSHIFPVSGDYLQPQVSGLQGVIDAYWDCLEKNMTPASPTCMTPCLSQTYRSIVGRTDAYQIVLFVTDGQCDDEDMKTLVDLIVDASEEAISIIIIGVGRGPFNKMEYLSADDKPLQSSDKKTMRRDIVGFVPFREYRNSLSELARETLKEIPGQFTSWTKVHKIKPDKRQSQSAGRDRQGSLGLAADRTDSGLGKMLSREPTMELAAAAAEAAGAAAAPAAQPAAPAVPAAPPPEHSPPPAAAQREPVAAPEPAQEPDIYSSPPVSTDSPSGGAPSEPACEWESHSDDDTGRRYYHNRRTQVSVWHEPPVYAEWKALHRPTADLRSSPLQAKVAVAERVASERAAALAAERLRAEEAEATAAVLASEAARLRRQNQKLQELQGELAQGSPPRPQPVPPPSTTPPQPPVPKSVTQRAPTSPDHCGAGSRSGSPQAPYHALPEAAPPQQGPSAAQRRQDSARAAVLQSEARRWAAARAAAPGSIPRRHTWDFGAARLN